MFYIGINQAVNPVVEGAPLNGNSIFAIISVYLFVVFYSVGWGPIPFILASETSVCLSDSHIYLKPALVSENVADNELAA